LLVKTVELRAKIWTPDFEILLTVPPQRSGLLRYGKSMELRSWPTLK